MPPDEVMSLTPRDYETLLKGEQERQFDEYERASQIAIMHEAARRAKRPKASDLFKRPDAGITEQSVKEKFEQSQHADEWLSQWNFEKKGGN